MYDAELDMEQNVENSLRKIIGLMKEYLPVGVEYEKCVSEYSRD